MREQITAVILAGGRGERLGGVEKALLTWRGQAFLEHILTALRPQARRVVVSIRSDSANYSAYETVRDEEAGSEGPLGGMIAGLRASSTALTLFLPCDNPTPAECLAERLAAALRDNDIAYATYHGDNHWLYALIRRERLGDLERFWQEGGRSPRRWYATQRCVAVPFDDLPASAFRNINSCEELARLNADGS